MFFAKFTSDRRYFNMLSSRQSPKRHCNCRRSIKLVSYAGQQVIAQICSNQIVRGITKDFGWCLIHKEEVTT